jgi:hypothetical protein
MQWRYMGSEGIAPSFLISVLDMVSGELHAPIEETPGTRFIGGWVGPWTGRREKKISYPYRKSNPNSLVARLSYPGSWNLQHI